jgi:DNA-binding transcriptional MocR family regulator
MRVVKDSVANVVRQYAMTNKLFTRKQAVADLGFTVNQVNHAVETLRQSGLVKSISHGLLVWVESEAHRPASSTVQDKVWRALQVNPTFTTQDVARQAGVRESYAGRKVREYRNAGMVEQCGMTRSNDNAPIRKWRLTAKGKENVDRPSLIEFEPDPLVDRAVKLNRLVCTGLAIRNGVDRKKAVELCDEIKGILTESGGNEND